MTSPPSLSLPRLVACGLALMAFGCSAGAGEASPADAADARVRPVDAQADHGDAPASGDAAGRDAPPVRDGARDGASGSATSSAVPVDATVADSTAEGGRADARGSDAADGPLPDAHADAGSGDTGEPDARVADTGAVDGGAGDGGAVDGSAPDGNVSDAAALDAPRVDGVAQEASVDAAPPQTRISVSPRPMNPPFSASIHDYYVRCASGSNALTVSMTASPGSAIELLQPVQTSPSQSQSVLVNVTENEAIVVGLEADSGVTSYWIRCLPSDFPPLQMQLHPEAGVPMPGYYLIGPTITQPAGKAYAMALDGNGVPVWYGTTETGGPAVDVDSVIPGVLSFVGIGPPPAGRDAGAFELHDLEAGTVSLVGTSGGHLDDHELQYLPNGDHLIFSEPIVTGVDLTGLGSFGASESVFDCVIQEVDATGALVWQWDAMDHLDPVQDAAWPVTMSVAGVQVVDTFHCNSIDVAPTGDLLVSARQMDSVFMVSKATGAIEWKLGGSEYTRDGAQFIAVVGDPMTSFHGPHDARLLPNGDVSLFDCQTGRASPARGVIYSVDFTAGTATVQWQYAASLPSFDMGSFRVYSDGSRVVGWGANQVSTMGFTEVDPGGEDLADLVFPGVNNTYRAIKLPTSAFDIGLLRATAGTN